MTKFLSLAAGLGACLVFQADAFAVAVAEVRITHITIGIDTGDPATSIVTYDADSNLLVSSYSGPGTNQQVDAFTDNPTFSMDVGKRYYADYSYTLTVFDDGLTADGPMHSYCIPSHYVSCVTGTGYEVAFAQLLVGYKDERTSNPFVTETGGAVKLVTDAGTTADRLTQSGVLEASLSTTNAYAAKNSSFGFYAYTFADGNRSALPVPEPTTTAMLLSGLALLAFAKWHHARRLQPVRRRAGE